MRFEKVITSENDEFSKLISCDFDNDTLLKKINIEPDDETFFYLNKNQYALLIEKQEIYAIDVANSGPSALYVSKVNICLIFSSDIFAKTCL